MARDEAQIRKRLEDERARLHGEIDFLTAENQDERYEPALTNHIADNATDMFTRERNLAVSGNAQDLLSQVDAALQRLDEGTYGTCARCGRPIDDERLEALPYAAYCITCQAEVEHERAR